MSNGFLDRMKRAGVEHGGLDAQVWTERADAFGRAGAIGVSVREQPAVGEFFGNLGRHRVGKTEPNFTQARLAQAFAGKIWIAGFTTETEALRITVGRREAKGELVRVSTKFGG